MSDIEGSTRLWERDPEAMGVAIPAHYAVLAEAIARHEGMTRPVERGEGDSVVAAFSRASDAVAAALDAQRAMAAQAWPDEIGLERADRACAPPRRSCATRATTSAPRSTAARACARSATAVRRC